MNDCNFKNTKSEFSYEDIGSIWHLMRSRSLRKGFNSLISKFIDWANAENHNKATERVVPFLRVNKGFLITPHRDLSMALEKRFQFVQLSNGTLRNGFVVIDPNKTTIKHCISKHETEMTDNVSDWIAYFSRI